MVKLGVRTAEEVLEQSVLTPDQKVVLEQVFQQCSNVGT